MTPLHGVPRFSRICSVAAFALASTVLHAAEITIHADRPGPTVSPTLYGLFFEDINRAGDGGLYAEGVQNRSFEDAFEPIAWTLLQTGGQGTMALDTSAPLNPKNRTSLRLDITAAGRVGVANQGFKGVPLQGKQPTEAALRAWIARSAEAAQRSTEGMNIVRGKDYDLSLYARTSAQTLTLAATLEKQDGTILARQEIAGIGSAWKQFETRLTAGDTDSNARLVISADTPATLWLDMVSLFPRDTFKGRKNGLRPDLARMMADTRPGLLRFPGGSFSEGAVLADAWRWKETIGDLAERSSNWNIWGYRTTNGLGFHEYLQMAEDLGAEPLFVAHVGMAERGFVPVDELEPWIQDVLDAIEYANGPVTSHWGALRAAAGHPEPFNLKYVEIGNENGMGYSWGGGTREDYLPRYKLFFERIKSRHPEILTIANIHTEPDVPAEVVDEHYYEDSRWFFRSATLYDTYDRARPKIYVGEYAARNDGGNGNMRAALAEAAFMTGMERNADVVIMSSYAPLFTNPQWQRWNPNAIVFNNTSVFGTPSYHVQALFSRNRPHVVLPVDLPPAASPIPTLFAVAGVTEDAGDIILKVVNSAAERQIFDIRIAGLQGALSGGTRQELSSAALTDENTFAQPNRIAPRITELPAFRQGNAVTFPPYSVTILRWTK